MAVPGRPVCRSSTGPMTDRCRCVPAGGGLGAAPAQQRTSCASRRRPGRIGTTAGLGVPVVVGADQIQDENHIRRLHIVRVINWSVRMG